jgi:hypothetical protein
LIGTTSAPRNDAEPSLNDDQELTMKKLMIAALALAPLAFATGAEAQGTARGAQRGVEDGSAAAGPVGGVVGGAVGAATGTVGGVLGTDTDPARRAREDRREERLDRQERMGR